MWLAIDLIFEEGWLFFISPVYEKFKVLTRLHPIHSFVVGLKYD